MAWLAVDKDQTETIFTECPHRGGHNPSYYVQGLIKEIIDNSEREDKWYPEAYSIDDDNRALYDDRVILPKGSIKKLIGRDLTWEDDPVEI